MGDKLTQPAKATHDTEAARPKAPADTETSDRLGTLAKADSSKETPTDERKGRAILAIAQSYTWFGKAASDRLNTLRRDLKDEDEPEWIEKIASGLLEMALGAGAAGAGAYLADKLISNNEGVKEFVKVMFEGHLGAGIALGRSKLAAGKDGHAVDPFIDAQITAVDKSCREAQTAFIMEGQDKLTGAQAEIALKEIDEAHVGEASQKQYESSRDSWVSYLAQTRFGAVGKRGGAVQPDSSKPGATTTNMSDRVRRKEVNKHAPGFVPEEAPEFRKAVQGDATGVLAVKARLPSIVAGLQLTGQPKVEHAFLNGVNGTIREQYENQPLSALHIPRQLLVTIEGETGNKFELGFNENGDLGGAPRSGPLHDWLVGRSTVAHPENASKSDFGKVFAGAKLLLDDLVVTSIRK